MRLAAGRPLSLTRLGCKEALSRRDKSSKRVSAFRVALSASRQMNLLIGARPKLQLRSKISRRALREITRGCGCTLRAAGNDTAAVPRKKMLDTRLAGRVKRTPSRAPSPLPPPPPRSPETKRALARHRW
ncbi:hypothetical protein PUN28_018166 [Cardiocondyla obscurior]|uniref:Uncharacterized protein n=1 Tax=Cardiocondyla obscurior TaxID=286306 RepID=A0AAW2EG39_9HYME